MKSIMENFIFCAENGTKVARHFDQRTLVGFIYETKYSRMDQVKFFKGHLPQILLGTFLNTLPLIMLDNNFCMNYRLFNSLYNSWVGNN